MRLKILSCEVLARELYFCAATSPHIIDITLVRRGLHDTPDILRAELQRHIDAFAAQAERADGAAIDAVCLGYGLCGNSIAGLTARRLPLVVPRAHDCITLYLGSRALYSEEFNEHPGTYYYAMDYIERREKGGSVVGLGALSDARRKQVYDEYVEKYGKDNADYLLEVMGGWTAHYNRAAYIDVGVGDGSTIESLARQEATAKGWAFEKLAGSLDIIRKLTHARWDEDFLTLPPGGTVEVTHDHNIVGCRVAAAG